MVKAQKRSKAKVVKQKAFTIIEQAQDSRQLKESLGERPLFFEDKLPQSNIKPPRVLKVDEILKSKSTVKSVSQVLKKKGNAESTLAKRFAKSKQPVKAKKEVRDMWENNNGGASKEAVVRIDPVAPQAMSYRPDLKDQMRILQAIEQREQERIQKMERYKEDAEVIKKAISTPDMQSQYLIISNQQIPSEEEVETESLQSDVAAPVGMVIKKTKQERAREQKEKDERVAVEKRKEEKKLDKQFDQIEAIAKKVKKEINKPKAKNGSKKALLTRIDVDQVILPEQVPASLREVSTAGNLVSDVFKSLKKRVAIGERNKKRTNTLPLRAYTLHCHK